MHFRVFVMFDKDKAEQEQAAREYCYAELLGNGFVDQDKLFNDAWGDWFVIGGRWSGELLGAEPSGSRDPYADHGHEGDAQVITSALYEKFLKECEGEWMDAARQFVVLEGEEVCPDFVGAKWLVVVDVHE